MQTDTCGITPQRRSMEVSKRLIAISWKGLRSFLGRALEDLYGKEPESYVLIHFPYHMNALS